MRRYVWSLLSLSLLFVCLLALAVPLCAQTASMDSEELAFVTLINNYRQQNGLQPLKISNTLQACAEWMSTDMATKNYFSHTDSLGRDPFQRMKAFGYTYNTDEGENIAAGNSTASATFTQWKNSAGHNANMLNANYKVMGIARATAAGSTYGWYWTNDFGGYDDSGSAPPPPTTDTTPPTVSITAPANGATVSGSITVSATAADNVGVQKVVFAVSNGTSVTDTTAPYSTTLNTASLSNGPYTITATAYDAAGNHRAQSVAVTVNNSTTPPPPPPPTTQKPGTPTSVRLSVQPTGAMLSWLPGTGGAPASYTIQVCRYPSAFGLVNTQYVPATSNSTRITVSITGTYYVHVCAVNAAGTSLYSPWVSGRIIAGQ